MNDINEFRKKVATRQKLYISMCLVLPITYFAMRTLAGGASDYMQGIITGVCSGMMVAAVFFAVRMTMLLRNEEKLREQFIKETDERNCAISKATMQTSSLITLFLTALAVIISGFLSKTVSMTLAADLIIGALISAVVHAYYNKKM